MAKNQNIKREQYCNKFNKAFKNGPHQKKFLKKKIKSRIRLVNAQWQQKISKILPNLRNMFFFYFLCVYQIQK